MLEVKDLYVRRGGFNILKGVSFSASTGEFVAIIGPNGAGKTTLFRAISGERPTSGEVLIQGESVYDSPEYWLQRIGYVPVDNVLHENLTVTQALQFVGRLRLPNIAVSEIDRKIAALLSSFEIQGKAKDYIRTLSSGEKKRVNICAELLTDPEIILLDEPTSNLDPNAELQLMQNLRDLAHSARKTVLVISHTLNSIDKCDKVVFVQNSIAMPVELPQKVLERMESEANINVQSTSPFERWAEVFEKYKTQQRKKVNNASLQKKSKYISGSFRKAFQIPFGYQLRLLLQRYGRIRINDRLVFVFTLAFGIVGGLFLLVLPADALIKPESSSEYATKIVASRQAVFIISLIVSLIGLIAGYQEISREFRIFRHERIKGQSPLAYALSKWIWLAVAVGVIAPISLIFVFLLLGQAFPNTPLSNTLVAFLTIVTLVLSCISAVSLGLAISAIAGGRDSFATALLAIVVIFHVLFSGLIKNRQIEDFINIASTLSTSRWSFEGFSSSVGFYCWATIKNFDEFNSISHIFSVWMSSVLYILVALVITVLALRARDPWLTPSSFGKSIAHDSKRILKFACVLAILLSWSLFFRSQSNTYHSLTYYDRFYGGFRFIHIEEDKQANFIERGLGLLGQSQCNRDVEIDSQE